MTPSASRQSSSGRPAGVRSVLEERAGPAPAQRVEAELSAALANHLLEGRKTADLGQTLLAAVTVFIYWGTVPRALGLGWFALFLTGAVLRGMHRARAAPRVAGSRALLRMVRRDVWLSASLWGIWALIMTGASPKDLAILMVIFAGLVAAATSTLVADDASFRGFMGLLMGPLALAILLGGVTRDTLVFVLLLGLYVPFMITVYRRAHQLLVDQIRTSSRLRITEEETARRRDFLNALVTSAPSPIVVADVEGNVLRINPAFEELLGYGWEDVGQEGFARRIATGDTASEVMAFLRRAGEGAREVREFPLTHRSGRLVWMRISGTAAGGTARGTVILVGEDVTEQVAARETLAEALRAAEEVARAKSAFLATMSHEIRTPLNGILGMIELMLDTELTDEQREHAEIIRSSGEGLLRVLNDILDVSKIEAGQLDLEDIDFEVGDLTAEAVRMFTVPAAAKHIEVIVDVQPDVPQGAHGDPVRIRQMLSNLLSNAVKFTHEGEIVVEVRLVEQHADGFVLRFSVRDTGIGIPHDKQQQIFDEFAQADSSTTRTYGGTGLGLAICRKLAELMGGDLGLDSEPGRGSEFHFTIPLKPAVNDRVHVRTRAHASLEERAYLVVDDNDNARRIVREMLEDVGGRVVTAASADEGFAAMRAALADGSRFAAVVLDHMMPDRDGLDLARQVKADPELATTPLLMLTSAGTPGSWEEVRQAGIAGCLTKPAARRDLLRALEELLGRPPWAGPERRLVTAESMARADTKAHILLAEDNVVNQKVAVSLLQKKGYEVTAVANGQEAIDALRDTPFGLVLMDIQMPVLDGLEATKRIRRMPGCETLPIVALTAHAFAEERERCEQAGMNDFLAKPFKPHELYDLVAYWSRVTRRTRQADEAGEDPMDDEGRTTPPVDIDGFREIMREAGVEEIVDTTLDIYVEEAPTIFDSIRAAVEARDAEGVRTAAHSLKSSSGNIRAHGLSELLQALEDMGKGGDLSDVGGLFGQLESEYRSVMTYLAERGSG